MARVCSFGALNGAAEVTLIAAPGADLTRTIRYINIYNRDTAAVTVTIKLADDAARYFLRKVTLAVDGNVEIPYPIVLDATDLSVIAVMSGAAATTNPDFVCSFEES